MKKLIAAFVLSWSTVVLAQADTNKCLAIKDSEKRLSCFDSSAKTTSKSTKNSKLAEVDRAKEEQKIAEEKALDAASNALKALQKFRYRVETGISYREYIAALGELKYEVLQFSNNNSVQSMADISEHMSASVTAYEYAGMVWRDKVNTANRYSEGYVDVDLVGTLLSMYPELNQYRFGRTLQPTATMQAIWRIADSKTSLADGLIKMVKQ